VVHDRKIAYEESAIRYHAPISVAATKLAREVADEVKARRILIMMLGDTSDGMINGYFGPRLLNRHGFTEHKDRSSLDHAHRRVAKHHDQDAARLHLVCHFARELGRRDRDGAGSGSRSSS